MAFSKDNRPKLPDSYFNFNNVGSSTVVPSPGSTVAIPILHDWGPFKEAQLVQSFAEFQALFGYSDDTPGYLAVKQAFIGEGLPGRGGAGAVLAYRFGASSAKAANKALLNTTPGTALTLTAKYKGTRGNDLRLTTRVNATNEANHDLVILDGTTVLETYTFAKTNITNAAEQINAHSAWVTAVANISGVALAIVSAQALTEGADGTSPTNGDWTAALDQIALERFGVFAPYDLTVAETIAAIKTWVRDQNDNKNKRFMAVIGGQLAESATTANSRSETESDPEIVNIGIGSYKSSNLGTGGGVIELSTSQLAPRIAGILAAKGEYASLTYARLADLSIVTGPTDAEIALAYDAGTLVLARDDDADAPMHIKVGHSTWGESDGAAEPLKPYKIYREPKYVRTMHGIQTDLSKYFRTEILGRRPVNDDTRDAVVSEAKSLLAERQALGVIQPGWKVGIAQNPPPSDDDEFIELAMELKFGRALKQVYVTLTVG